MTKQRVLEIFTENGGFVTPDEVRKCLQRNPQRSSVYSYLSRLCRQGLLERAEGWAWVAYRITPRGTDRLEYFRAKNR